jgi:hypothetical protein
VRFTGGERWWLTEERVMATGVESKAGRRAKKAKKKVAKKKAAKKK